MFMAFAVVIYASACIASQAYMSPDCANTLVRVPMSLCLHSCFPACCIHVIQTVMCGALCCLNFCSDPERRRPELNIQGFLSYFCCLIVLWSFSICSLFPLCLDCGMHDPVLEQGFKLQFMPSSSVRLSLIGRLAFGIPAPRCHFFIFATRAAINYCISHCIGCTLCRAPELARPASTHAS